MAQALRFVIDTLSRELKSREMADPDTYVWCLQLFPTLFTYGGQSYADDWRHRPGVFYISEDDLAGDLRKKAVNAWRRGASGYLGGDVRAQRQAFEKSAGFIDASDRALLNREGYSDQAVRAAFGYLLGSAGTRGGGIFGNKNLPWAHVVDYPDACLGEKDARSQFLRVFARKVADDFDAVAEEFGGFGALDSCVAAMRLTFERLSDELDYIAPGQPAWRAPARLLTFVLLCALYGPHDYGALFGMSLGVAAGRTVNGNDPFQKEVTLAAGSGRDTRYLIAMIEYTAPVELGNYRAVGRPVALGRGCDLVLRRESGAVLSSDGRELLMGIGNNDRCISREEAVRLSVAADGACLMHVGNTFGAAVFRHGGEHGTFFEKDASDKLFTTKLGNGDIVALTPCLDDASGEYWPRPGALSFRVERR